MIQDKEPYEYRLTYIDGDYEVTHTFSAFCTGNEMRDNLRHFLRACSWSDNAVDLILNGGLEE